jgi:hypothetical protein
MGKTERSNGAFGKSDIEVKTARVAASDLGEGGVSNAREHMTQPGKRTSFISSIAMRRQTHKAKKIMRPARLLYFKPQISDLIILKKEPHDEHITRLSRMLRLLTLSRA